MAVIRNTSTIVAACASLLFTAPAWASCRGPECKNSSSETVDPIKPPDFSDITSFSRLGEYFTFSRATNVFSVAGGGVVGFTAPFAFNIGTRSSLVANAIGEPAAATTSMLYVKEDGVVSFGQSLAAGSFAAITDLQRLGVPLIAPFYADLDQNSRAAIGAGLQGVVIQTGLADPFADASGAYSLANAKTAVRITWYGFDTTQASGATLPVYVQLLLIDEGNGDFDFKIRAGAPGSTSANSPAGGIGGFVLGDSYYQYATPYSQGYAGTFNMRGGDIVASGVPEPATWLMMVGGFSLIGGALRRRPSRVRRSAKDKATSLMLGAK